MYKKGFIKTIIIIVIMLIVLGYFGFNIEDIVNEPLVQKNLHAFWNFILKIWSNYLSVPIMWFWNTFIIGILWKFIQMGLNNIH
ncbi:MAG: hypothetical protein V1651_01510 [Patescibacteria group bacterium]